MNIMVRKKKYLLWIQIWLRIVFLYNNLTYFLVSSWNEKVVKVTSFIEIAYEKY